MSAEKHRSQRPRKVNTSADCDDKYDCTGGDQDPPKKPYPTGRPTPPRPRPQAHSAGGNLPATQGYPGGQPPYPDTRLDPYGRQYRTAESPGSDPQPGGRHLGESADYYEDHPQRSHTRPGHSPTPSGYSQPNLYPPIPSQHSQPGFFSSPQALNPQPYSPQGPYPPTPNQSRQQSMQDPKPPQPPYLPTPNQSRQQSMQEPYQPNPSPRSSQPSRAYSTGSGYQPSPKTPYHQPYDAQQPEVFQRVRSHSQVAEPEMIQSSRNPKMGTCSSCGDQHFLNP